MSFFIYVTERSRNQFSLNPPPPRRKDSCRHTSGRESCLRDFVFLPSSMSSGLCLAFGREPRGGEEGHWAPDSRGPGEVGFCFFLKGCAVPKVPKLFPTILVYVFLTL